ncbi:hypothetical protein GQ43DRAFT_219391 [Delitschia confertaspora ATCC 74209]|uniref:Uncharacterized protein n=1 Tax=Delitschia confertaspora ATCC 74209 TaxID=1513339 RepID=A0A9P4JFW6_9PLEO|nr:hypothetical protein GQ43DRAFT_219391 [Delitschia confertaspora ATCC 74209]
MPLENVQEQFDKYKLWTGNIGATHSGNLYQISLDYRLREAAFFKRLGPETAPLFGRKGKKGSFKGTKTCLAFSTDFKMLYFRPIHIAHKANLNNLFPRLQRKPTLRGNDCGLRHGYIFIHIWRGRECCGKSGKRGRFIMGTIIRLKPKQAVGRHRCLK